MEKENIRKIEGLYKDRFLDKATEYEIYYDRYVNALLRAAETKRSSDYNEAGLALELCLGCHNVDVWEIILITVKNRQPDSAFLDLVWSRIAMIDLNELGLLDPVIAIIGKQVCLMNVMAIGPNVQNRKLFNMLSKDPDNWYTLACNKYLDYSEKSDLFRIVIAFYGKALFDDQELKKARGTDLELKKYKGIYPRKLAFDPLLYEKRMEFEQLACYNLLSTGDTVNDTEYKIKRILFGLFELPSSMFCYDKAEADNKED